MFYLHNTVKNPTSEFSPSKIKFCISIPTLCSFSLILFRISFRFNHYNPSYEKPQILFPNRPLHHPITEC